MFQSWKPLAEMQGKLTHIRPMLVQHPPRPAHAGECSTGFTCLDLNLSPKLSYQDWPNERAKWMVVAIKVAMGDVDPFGPVLS